MIRSSAGSIPPSSWKAPPTNSGVALTREHDRVRGREDVAAVWAFLDVPGGGEAAQPLERVPLSMPARAASSLAVADPSSSTRKSP
jgi:hypothetical protein